jgi:hypothetical protein
MKLKTSILLTLFSILFIFQPLSAQKSKVDDYNIRWATRGINSQLFKLVLT